MGQQALAQAEVWKCGRDQLEFRISCSSKIVPDSDRRIGTQRVGHVPSTSHGSRHRSGAGCQHSARSAKKRGDWHHSLPRPLHELETLAHVPKCGDQAIADPAVHKRMTGKCFIVVDLACSRKRRIIWVCLDMCSTQSLDPSMT